MIIFTLITHVTCSNLANSMFNLINSHRNSAGLAHLKSIPNLENAARVQALYMCENSNLTHDNPEGDLKERTTTNGFKGSKVGENIARNHSDDYNEVAKLWMESPRHKGNILGDFNYTGVATCLDKIGNRFWAQVFGKDEGSDDNMPVLDEEKEPRKSRPRKKKRTVIRTSIIPVTSSMSSPCLEDDEPVTTTRTIMIFSTISPIMSSKSRQDTVPVSIMTVTKTTLVTLTAQNSTPDTVIETSTIASTERIVTTNTVTKTSFVTVSVQPQRVTTEIVKTVTVSNVSTVTMSMDSTVTVTQPTTRFETKTVTAIQSVESKPAPRTQYETVTVTQLSDEYEAPRTHRKTVTVTQSSEYSAPRSASSTRTRPRLFQLVPEREVDLETLAQSTDMFENTIRKRVPKPEPDEDRIDIERRQMIDGMKKGLKGMNGKQRFLNSMCGTKDNPCVKAILIRE